MNNTHKWAQKKFDSEKKVDSPLKTGNINVLTASNKVRIIQ